MKNIGEMTLGEFSNRMEAKGSTPGFVCVKTLETREWAVNSFDNGTVLKAPTLLEAFAKLLA